MKKDGQLRRVIHDVSLAVDSGEVLGVVGESGSGKSMTARAIMRLLMRGARVTGDIRFDGVSVSAMDARALRRHRSRDVSMIYQDPRAHINPVRTVGDFLVEALCATGGASSREARDRAIEILREVGIHDAPRRMHQYPHQLSGGLLQRVMIATGLICGPRLLLADEPTTALDVTTQEEVMAILDEQRVERDLAMIIITHDLDLAAAVADRLAVMYAGVIVESAPSASLRTRALHPYTVGLLASRPSGTRVRRLATIPGRPVSAFEAGPGCVFASRCPFAEQQCHRERPVLRQLAGHDVACHRAEELQGAIDYPVEAKA
ncbi:ABC transporter ATP-binding protein [Streptomyces sp. NPDC096311]|uniref:ABC transporter ATP-binding protein n=1 Tax=Streptomyces sp. NPDC096311 TaxID=3366083 RepID=UPI0038292A73